MTIRAATQVFPQIGRHQVAFSVIVVRVRRQQNPQAVTNGDTRRYDQEPVGEPVVLRTRRLIQGVPCDDHPHHHSLPGTGSHLLSDPEQTRVVAGRLLPEQVHDPVVAELAGRLGEVDRGLERLDLTEEQRTFAFGIGPELEEAACRGGHAPVAALTPHADAFPDPVDRRILLETIRRPFRLERLLTAPLARARNRNEVRARPTTIDEIRGDALLVESEMPVGLPKRRVDDRVLDDGVTWHALPTNRPIRESHGPSIPGIGPARMNWVSARRIVPGQRAGGLGRKTTGPTNRPAEDGPPGPPAGRPLLIL